MTAAVSMSTPPEESAEPVWAKPAEDLTWSCDHIVLHILSEGQSSQLLTDVWKNTWLQGSKRPQTVLNVVSGKSRPSIPDVQVHADRKSSYDIQCLF